MARTQQREDVLHTGTSQSPPPERPSSPGEYIIAQEETTTTTIHHEPVAPAPRVPTPRPVTPTPTAPIIVPLVAPAPSPAPAPATTPEQDELRKQYADALGEIARLQDFIAAQSASAAQQPVGVRRRTTRVVSEDGESVGGGSDDGTAVESLVAQSQPEGVPVQVVAGIAFAVFLATYLFF